MEWREGTQERNHNIFLTRAMPGTPASTKYVASRVIMESHKW